MELFRRVEAVPRRDNPYRRAFSFALRMFFALDPEKENWNDRLYSKESA